MNPQPEQRKPTEQEIAELVAYLNDLENNKGQQ